jgi:hypothetical protein
MGDGALIHLDVGAYARLSAQLAAAGSERDALLASHGLDEDGWDAIEQVWLERFSQAEDVHGQGDGVPQLLAAYAEAFTAAQTELAGVVLTFERYVEITRAMSRGRDMAQLLDRFGIDLATYLHSHRHWTVKMASDRDLAEQLQRAMR